MRWCYRERTYPRVTSMSMKREEFVIYSVFMSGSSNSCGWKKIRKRFSRFWKKPSKWPSGMLSVSGCCRLLVTLCDVVWVLCSARLTFCITSSGDRIIFNSRDHPETEEEAINLRWGEGGRGEGKKFRESFEIAFFLGREVSERIVPI